MNEDLMYRISNIGLVFTTLAVVLWTQEQRGKRLGMFFYLVGNLWFLIFNPYPGQRLIFACLTLLAVAVYSGVLKRPITILFELLVLKRKFKNEELEKLKSDEYE
jgi:hypothetical protein